MHVALQPCACAGLLHLQAVACVQAFPAAWSKSLDADCIVADLSRVRSGG